MTKWFAFGTAGLILALWVLWPTSEPSSLPLPIPLPHPTANSQSKHRARTQPIRRPAARRIDDGGIPAEPIPRRPSDREPRRAMQVDPGSVGLVGKELAEARRNRTQKRPFSAVDLVRIRNTVRSAIVDCHVEAGSPSVGHKVSIALNVSSDGDSIQVNAADMTRTAEVSGLGKCVARAVMGASVDADEPLTAFDSYEFNQSYQLRK